MIGQVRSIYNRFFQSLCRSSIKKTGITGKTVHFYLVPVIPNEPGILYFIAFTIYHDHAKTRREIIIFRAWVNIINGFITDDIVSFDIGYIENISSVDDIDVAVSIRNNKLAVRFIILYGADAGFT